MSNKTPDLSQMLVMNLASAASRKGGLDETEAERWATAQSTRILQSGLYDFDSLELLILDEAAAILYWLHDRLNQSVDPGGRKCRSNINP